MRTLISYETHRVRISKNTKRSNIIEIRVGSAFTLKSATTQLSQYQPTRTSELVNDGDDGSEFISMDETELITNATDISPLEALDDWNFA